MKYTVVFESWEGEWADAIFDNLTEAVVYADKMNDEVAAPDEFFGVYDQDGNRYNQ